MKTSALTAVFLTALAISPACGEPYLPSWTNTNGVTIHGEFIRLEGESLLIRKDGKEFKVPLEKLSEESREQALEMASSPQSAPEEPSGPAKDFGKQADPDHQRKLAVFILAKIGKVTVTSGSREIAAATVDDLPKGRLSIKSLEAIGEPFTDEDAALLNGCGDLTRLVLHGATLEGLPLASLPALQYLEMEECGIAAGQFHSLMGHKKLAEILITSHASPSMGGLIPILATCPGLTSIRLHKAGLAAAPLAPLSKLRLLKTLSLGGNDYTDADLSALQDFPSLVELALQETDLGNHTLDFLPKLKSLQTLNLYKSKIQEKCHANIASTRGLTCLSLYSSNATNPILHALSGHKTLRELHVSLTQITGEALIGLAPMPGVTEFHIGSDKSRIDDAAAKSLAQTFPNAAYVSFYPDLRSGGYKAIADLRRLAYLRLHSCATLDDDSVRALAGMKKLNRLQISGPAVTNTGLQLLEPLKSQLIELSLSGARIDDEAVPTLAKFRSLSLLEITETGISREGADRLRKALPVCKVTY